MRADSTNTIFPPIRNYVALCQTVCFPVALDASLTICVDTWANEDGAGWKRWAAVPCNDVVRSGITDLIVVQLSQKSEIELVEREQINRVTRELELDAYFGAEASQNRLKLGRLLRADVLLLLEKRQGNGLSHLRVVVSDCRYGARLFSGYLLMDNEKDALASSCADIVRRVRKRFSSGIKYLITVPPFHCKNLVHDYDHLQNGLAALVADSLTTYSGVAVVEIAEARQIARELELTDRSLRRHVVPAFVTGEFKTTGSNVHMKVDVADSEGTVCCLDENISSKRKLLISLTSTVPRAILRLAADAVPIDRSSQQARLIDQATLFSQVGSYVEAAGLREAALLLDPNDDAQRVELLADYRMQAKSRFEALRLKQPRAERVAEQLQFFHLMTPHIRRIIDRGALNPAEAGYLVYVPCCDLRFNAQPGSRGCRKAIEELFWDVAARIFQLEPKLDDDRMWRAMRRYCYRSQVSLGRRSEGDIRGWMFHATPLVLTIAPEAETCAGPDGLLRPCDDEHTLDHLYKYFTTVLPDSQPYRWALQTLVASRGGLARAIREGRFTADQVDVFCRRLEQSGHAQGGFYGRCGRLALKTHFAHGELTGTELDELDELIAWLGRSKENSRLHAERVGVLESLRRPLTVKLKGVSLRTPVDIPVNPIPPHDANPRLTFHPVSDIRPDWWGMVACGENRDIAWSERRAVAIHWGIADDARIVNLFQAERDSEETVRSVVWDGEFAWVVTSHRGVLVVSLDGTQRAQFHSPQGLPPYNKKFTPSALDYLDTSLNLFAVEPGRCLAIGIYGENQRTWIADLILDKSHSPQLPPRVEVFHTATRSASNVDASSDGADVVFQPSWFTKYPTLNRPSVDVVLIGRNHLAADHDGLRHPLAIDLRDRKVTVWQHRLPAYGNPGHLPVRVGRHLLFTGLLEVFTYSPTTAPSPRLRKTVLHRVPTHVGRRVRADRVDLRRQLLMHGGAIHNPGGLWHQIDPRTFATEPLYDSALPNQFRFMHYAGSSRWGLVAWNRGDRLYDVQVASERNGAADVDDLYHFVPAAKRLRHHKAVNTIRRLGGYVDFAWAGNWFVDPRLRYSREAGRDSAWQTIVFLSKDWKGDSEGLGHLEDLFALQTLYVVLAPIGNAGLERIGRLGGSPPVLGYRVERSQDGLHCLFLVGSQASDEAADHFKSLHNLELLRLDGQFTDLSVENLSSLPLGRVELCGPGFTDQSAMSLSKLKYLRRVVISNTRITDAGVRAITSNANRVNVSDYLSR